jgi:hypothetical protein
MVGKWKPIAELRVKRCGQAGAPKFPGRRTTARRLQAKEAALLGRDADRTARVRAVGQRQDARRATHAAEIRPISGHVGDAHEDEPSALRRGEKGRRLVWGDAAVQRARPTGQLNAGDRGIVLDQEGDAGEQAIPAWRIAEHDRSGEDRGMMARC